MDLRLGEMLGADELARAELYRRRHDYPVLQASLTLADGSSFRGLGLGTPGAIAGELVFTTAMTGYQEALTDPSYRGQVLLFTYPLIGNYGMDPGRAQSDAIHPRAAIVATLSESGPGQPSLATYLRSHRVPTMHSVDTRAIAQQVRRHGAMAAVLSVHEPGCAPLPQEVAALLLSCERDETDLIAQVTAGRSATYGDGRKRVALLDCGNKSSVIRELTGRDAQVVVLPAGTGAEEIMALAPDGLVISNGPGDPAAATPVIATIRTLYGTLPMFGICLGHQLLALAAGASTYKLKFGHRGANQPVQNCLSGQAFITTQNHGYAVDDTSLPASLLVSHRNLNDGTIEGLRHRFLPVRSVQFHPEGSPGPRESGVVLDEWLAEVA